MRWDVHVTHTEEIRNPYKLCGCQISREYIRSSRSRWGDAKLQFNVDSKDGKAKVVPVLNLLSTTS
jgi:hypothetical protein